MVQAFMQLPPIIEQFAQYHSVVITADIHWAGGATSVGTVGAVVLALVLASKDGRRRRKEQEIAQASKVIAWIELVSPLEQNIFIQNDSGLPIYRFRIRAEFRKDELYCHNYYQVPPGRYVGRMSNDKAPPELLTKGRLDMWFDDVAGNHWYRAKGGTLRQLRESELGQDTEWHVFEMQLVN